MNRLRSKTEHAQELRAAGMPYRQIAAVLERSAATIQRWCNPAYVARDREHKQRWAKQNAERQREHGRRYRERNQERERARQARYKAENRDALRVKNREYNRAYPEKSRARLAVQRAIGSGDLVRPPACESCGAIAAVHAHHEDYARQLDVSWLCVACHGYVHRKAA